MVVQANRGGPLVNALEPFRGQIGEVDGGGAVVAVEMGGQRQACPAAA